LPDLPAPACAYAFAMAPGEFGNLSGWENYFSAAPVILFLNRVRLQMQEYVNIEMEEDCTPPGLYQHVFKIDLESPLTSGLPGRVVTYGPLTDITPLLVEPGLQVLVWLDGMPIIGYRAPHLFVGADAWQLGNPTVPMLYAILLNWLRTVVGCDLRVTEPLAAIRLDDLPVTAEYLLHRQPSPALDRQRATTLRRLRKFALRRGIRLNLMYTSHFYSAEGNILPIGDAMPLSICEMRLGVEQQVFEIGAHGMFHLRYERAIALKDADPREFLDLDEKVTMNHLSTCVGEIRRLFGVNPASFVAPAWGYLPGLTKRIAGQLFKTVIDSSQHMEDGSANVFSLSGEEYPAFNCSETFRPGNRMLSYISPDFWRCYALAGIPVHYMQHTDTNWHLLREFLDQKIGLASFQPGGTNARLVTYIHNAENKRLGRSVLVAWLAIQVIWRSPSFGRVLWKLLTCSSLYAIFDALYSAGYHFSTLDQLFSHDSYRCASLPN
jgi:hypothetical protein